ncbi:MAG: hypothetical protein R3325_01560 [Thermoanaerobaculia bacterium]|nr:hypothetical protein [Thermoanaerobaculia bacterium]
MPPHVFGLDERRLRYGRFVVGDGAVGVDDLREVELAPETIAAGPLGGTLREPSGLRQALDGLLAQIGVPVTEASLVLPDSWVRLVFAEGEALPRAAAQRDEVLRFKLKRLIPFRAEDLRLAVCPAPPLAEQEEPSRHLLAFGMESLLQQVEAAFARRGVRLGQVSNATLALLAGVRESLAGLDLSALLYARDSEYSLTFLTAGEPVVHRYKVSAAGTPAEVRVAQHARDLRLTRKFVRDRLGQVRLRRVVLAASESSEPVWRPLLEEVFQVPVTGLAELPRLAAARSGGPDELGPFLGAACRAA